MSPVDGAMIVNRPHPTFDDAITGISQEPSATRRSVPAVSLTSMDVLMKRVMTGKQIILTGSKYPVDYVGMQGYFCFNRTQIFPQLPVLSWILSLH